MQVGRRKARALLRLRAKPTAGIGAEAAPRAGSCGAPTIRYRISDPWLSGRRKRDAGNHPGISRSQYGRCHGMLGLCPGSG